MVSCKTQKNNQTETPDLTHVTDYKVNPNEVILHLKITSCQKKQSDNWHAQAIVIQQYKAGFSYKKFLKPEQQITFESSEEFSQEIIAAMRYIETPGGEGVYTLVKRLKKTEKIK